MQKAAILEGGAESIKYPMDSVLAQSVEEGWHSGTQEEVL